MPLVIRKKITLEFLGEEYKDSYISLRSIPLKEYEDLKKSEATVAETVIDRFVEGKIAQDGKQIDITAENVNELPAEVFTEAFNQLTGVKIPENLEKA